MTLSRSLLAGTLALLLAGAAAAQQPPSIPPPASTAPRSLDLPNAALVADGDPAELELLFTGDVIGFIEPCG